jgi:glycosyltransferase involved in cell wall biosynthesis
MWSTRSQEGALKSDPGLNRTEIRKYAFIGCCLPRRCGIATFTYDLAEAVANQSRESRSVVIVAVNDRPEGYPYPERVSREIDFNDPHEYKLAAEYLNDSCDVVCLQHEFGLFGPPWGNNVLHLVRRLRRPLVVTCHTVPVDPDPDQRHVFGEIVGHADRIVVMNVLAVDFLQALYGARYNQIVHIRHGIHDMPFGDPPARKVCLDVDGPVLMTFGLINRGKGLENAIDAMAEVVLEYPDACYVIAGRTHPKIVEVEGESYRRSLHGRVKRLGLERNVKFIDKFSELCDLKKYLEETDIFLAPYLDMGQMTSGALAYAAGAGKAIVATPFLHARELLAGERGHLTPVGNPQALARHVIDLLSDKRGTTAMRRRIYKHTRDMNWDVVAGRYLELFESVRQQKHKTVPQPQQAVRTGAGSVYAGGPQN